MTKLKEERFLDSNRFIKKMEKKKRRRNAHAYGIERLASGEKISMPARAMARMFLSMP